MDKDAQTDLFLWILGTLLVAMAVPAVLAFTQPAAQPVRVVAAPAQPSTIAASLSTPVTTPAPTAPVAATTSVTPTIAEAAHLATRPTLPDGQVWQCVVNRLR
jgi:glucose/arabinose dehydrogenase